MQDTAIAYFCGMAGAAAAMTLSGVGAAMGTAKAGMGVVSLGFHDEKLVIKGLVPTILAGIVGIYGLIVGIIIVGSIPDPRVESYPTWRGQLHLAAGLCCGFSGLFAGYAIGVIGDSGVRAYGKQQKTFMPMILAMIFVEALAIYGLIVALVLSVKQQ